MDLEEEVCVLKKRVRMLEKVLKHLHPELFKCRMPQQTKSLPYDCWVVIAEKCSEIGLLKFSRVCGWAHSLVANVYKKRINATRHLFGDISNGHTRTLFRACCIGDYAPFVDLRIGETDSCTELLFESAFERGYYDIASQIYKRSAYKELCDILVKCLRVDEVFAEKLANKTCRRLTINNISDDDYRSLIKVFVKANTERKQTHFEVCMLYCVDKEELKEETMKAFNASQFEVDRFEKRFERKMRRTARP